MPWGPAKRAICQCDTLISYPDFLGYNRRQALPGSMRPFKAARAFVRKLKLESKKEWQEWAEQERHASPQYPVQPRQDVRR